MFLFSNNNVGHTHGDCGKKSGIYGLVSYCCVNQNANQQKLFAFSARNVLKITETARNY